MASRYLASLIIGVLLYFEVSGYVLEVRGYPSLGGEMFVVLLPMAVVFIIDAYRYSRR